MGMSTFSRMLNIGKATLRNYSDMNQQAPSQSIMGQRLQAEGKTQSQPIARQQAQLEHEKRNALNEDNAASQDMFVIDFSAPDDIELQKNPLHVDDHDCKRSPKVPKHIWESSSESEPEDLTTLSHLKKSSVDYPCCTPDMRTFFKRRKELQEQYQKLHFDWNILDRICHAKSIEKEVCDACRSSGSVLYLMLSTYGKLGPMKTVLYCVCQELDEKYFPLNETLSVNFATSDTISAIYNFVQKNNEANKYVYGL